jgi:hypothetical protein
MEGAWHITPNGEATRVILEHDFDVSNAEEEQMIRAAIKANATRDLNGLKRASEYA